MYAYAKLHTDALESIDRNDQKFNFYSGSGGAKKFTGMRGSWTHCGFTSIHYLYYNTQIVQYST